MKIHTGKNGAYVTFDRGPIFYTVTLRDAAGEIADKVRCDDYRAAVEYRKAFIKLARSSAL